MPTVRQSKLIYRVLQFFQQQLTSVGLIYIHTCRSYIHTTRDFTNGASLAWRLRRRISTCGWAWPPRLPIRPILGFWGAKFTQICYSLPWMPMNRRTKCDAASFIPGGEIRNRTNRHTNKQ